jgi:hypothetical protein
MSSSRPHPVKSTPLRDRMMYQMQLHRLAPGTQKSYANAITESNPWSAQHLASS